MPPVEALGERALLERQVAEREQLAHLFERARSTSWNASSSSDCLRVFGSAVRILFSACTGSAASSGTVRS